MPGSADHAISSSSEHERGLDGSGEPYRSSSTAAPRKGAERDHAQRDAMNQVRTLGADNPRDAGEAAYHLHDADAATLAFQRHDAETLCLDARRVLAHARRNHDLEAHRAGFPRH